jgi:hypothetical protein
VTDAENMRPRFLTLAAGLVLGVVTAQAHGMFGGGSPTALSPVSILLAIPLFLGVPFALVVLGFVGLFWIWGAQLFSGDASIPRRTASLVVVTTLLSTIVFATSWKLGFAYQGVTHTVTCAIASAVMLAGCGLLLGRLRKHPSFEGSLALHTLLFAWIASYAFPYLGETP